MPKFELNKLVRDGYPDEYLKSGQKAEYRELSSEEHMYELTLKIIEEARELGSCGDDSRVGELADIIQSIRDYMAISGIDAQMVEDKIESKSNKIGGFAAGIYVKSIELSDDDPWVEYYRSDPKKYPEK